MEEFRHLATAITGLERRLDRDLWQVVEHLDMNRNAPVAFTGTGKSGLVASLGAALLRSVGFVAHYSHFDDLFHGDLGALQRGSSLVVVSKSLSDPRLPRLLKRCKRDSVTPILLRHYSEEPFDIPEFCLDIAPVCEPEIGEGGLLPSTSLVVMVSTLVVIVSRVASRNPLALLDNHPSGAIGTVGERLVGDLTVDLDECAILSTDMTLTSAAEAMSARNRGLGLVLDGGGHCVGVVSDGDLRRAVTASSSQDAFPKVGDFMSSDPLVIEAHEVVREALRKMTRHSNGAVSVVPVEREAVCIGVFGMKDAVRFDQGQVDS